MSILKAYRNGQLVGVRTTDRPYTHAVWVRRSERGVEAHGGRRWEGVIAWSGRAALAQKRAEAAGSNPGGTGWGEAEVLNDIRVHEGPWTVADRALASRLGKGHGPDRSDR